MHGSMACVISKTLWLIASIRNFDELRSAESTENYSFHTHLDGSKRLLNEASLPASKTPNFQQKHAKAYLLA